MSSAVEIAVFIFTCSTILTGANMRKIQFILAIFSVSVLGFINVYSNVNVGRETPYIEKGAKHSRLDKVKGLSDYERTNNGSWEIVNNHVGDWGNSSCSMPGNVCQRGDYYTWWYNVEPPVEPSTEKGRDMEGAIPIRWDMHINDYIWKMP